MPRHDEIEALFHEALALGDGMNVERWLRERSHGDLELVDEVASLLEAHAATRCATTPPAPAQDVPRARFGPFRAVELIGRGGMSVVYRACRADGGFEQTVALKVMAVYLSGPEFLRRFQVERQLLASLNHPHIARLLDGGVSSAGDPYLITELVEGEPLDRYCDERRLDVASRLRLFLQLCDAVEYAHRNLILHRDLKPANILVTAGGAVKLLDFGTAALVADQPDTTVTRSRMLTPRYASPEQLRGERSTIAGDVFSLGVILYELLTGAWPFGDPNSLVRGLERAIGDSNPAAPSACITQEAAELRSLPCPNLRRLIEGDLSAVLLKALEMDPSRRYVTAGHLAEDVDRFLSGRPVQARPQTAIYRTGKFLRRHWLAASAAAVFVMAITAATTVAVVEAKAARDEERKAQITNQFLTNMLASARRFSFDPAKYTVKEMLDSADRELEAGPRKDLHAEALLRLSLASSYFALSQDAKAKSQLLRAIPVLRARGDVRELADALYVQANMESMAGNFDSAGRLYQEALSHLQRLGRRAQPTQLFTTKSAYAELLALSPQNRREEARALYRELLDSRAPDRSIPRAQVALALAGRGGLLLSEGKDREAEAVLQKALATGRQEDPGGFWELTPLYNLNVIQVSRRDYSAATETATKMVEVATRAVGPDNPRTAQYRIIWARCASETNEKQAAAESVAQAMPVLEKSYPSPSLELWHAARDSAHVLRLAGSMKEAERYARESLSVAQAARMADNDPRLGNSWEELGLTLREGKRRREASRALERAAAIYAAAGPKWAIRAETIRRLVAGTRPEPGGR
ncbi:MAG: protein kinase [Acidobacteria bacterium]|nr:protein kinase [Acidobacteriota bacterium]